MLSCKNYFWAFFQCNFRKFIGAVFSKCPKNCDFGPKQPFFGLIWPNLAPKTNFLRQNDYSILLNYFWAYFQCNFRKFVGAFFRNVPKSAILAKNGHFLARQAKFGQNENFSQKRTLLFFKLIFPQLHAKFRKNPWSGFRD